MLADAPLSDVPAKSRMHPAPPIARSNLPQEDNGHMKLIDFLVETFINTFGITRPTEAGRRVASFFILGLMILVLVAVIVTGMLLRNAMR